MALTAKTSIKIDRKVIYEILKDPRDTQKHSHIILEVVES